MGKVKFKPGYVDLGAYPLLLHIVSEGGLEADGGGLNTTLTDPLTVTNVNGNTLLIGNGTDTTSTVFISATDANKNIVGLTAVTDSPFSGMGFNVRTDIITGDSVAAFEVFSIISGDGYYKTLTQTIDGGTGENSMGFLCFKNNENDGAVMQFDDIANDSFIAIGTVSNTYDKTYLFTLSTIVGNSPIFGVTVNGAIETILPDYATNVAADADTALPQGGLYTLTGDRTVYKKP